MVRNILVIFCAVITFISVDGAIVCPPEDDYAPCTCTECSRIPGTIFLNCFGRNLTDSRVSDMLDAFITTPGVSPMAELNLFNSQLTRVPNQIKYFPQLEIVYLNDNKIESIDEGTFNFTGTSRVLYIYLNDNQLSRIAPGAFQGNAYDNYTQIWLPGNQLTRFEATVFQSVLEKMAPFGDVFNDNINVFDNPFDCSDCHLAWLIRDNRQLLSAVNRGACSNGTRFTQLDPNGYADCPSFVCPLGYDGNYANPLNCSSYYKCSENIAYLIDCSADLVFNPETGQCDTITNVPSCQ